MLRVAAKIQQTLASTNQQHQQPHCGKEATIMASKWYTALK